MKTANGKNLKSKTTRDIKRNVRRRERRAGKIVLQNQIGVITSHVKKTTIEEQDHKITKTENIISEYYTPRLEQLSQARRTPNCCGNLVVIDKTVFPNLKGKENFNKAETFLRKTRNKLF